jgi:hypothetical protein
MPCSLSCRLLQAPIDVVSLARGESFTLGLSFDLLPGELLSSIHTGLERKVGMYAETLTVSGSKLSEQQHQSLYPAHLLSADYTVTGSRPRGGAPGGQQHRSTRSGSGSGEFLAVGRGGTGTRQPCGPASMDTHFTSDGRGLQPSPAPRVYLGELQVGEGGLTT